MRHGSKNHFEDISSTFFSGKTQAIHHRIKQHDRHENWTNFWSLNLLGVCRSHLLAYTSVLRSREREREPLTTNSGPVKDPEHWIQVETNAHWVRNWCTISIFYSNKNSDNNVSDSYTDMMWIEWRLEPYKRGGGWLIRHDSYNVKAY